MKVLLGFLRRGAAKKLLILAILASFSASILGTPKGAAGGPKLSTASACSSIADAQKATVLGNITQLLGSSTAKGHDDTASNPNNNGRTCRDCDLTCADLSNTYLGGADLTGAKLTNADLSVGDPNYQSMINVKLDGADLTGANLTNVYLSGATVVGTDFTNAIFTGASLVNIMFNETILAGTTFSGTTFNGCGWTSVTFGDTASPSDALAGAKGLGDLTSGDWSTTDANGKAIEEAVLAMRKSKSASCLSVAGQYGYTGDIVVGGAVSYTFTESGGDDSSKTFNLENCCRLYKAPPAGTTPPTTPPAATCNKYANDLICDATGAQTYNTATSDLNTAIANLTADKTATNAADKTFQNAYVAYLSAQGVIANYGAVLDSMMSIAASAPKVKTVASASEVSLSGMTADAVASQPDIMSLKSIFNNSTNGYAVYKPTSDKVAPAFGTEPTSDGPTAVPGNGTGMPTGKLLKIYNGSKAPNQSSHYYGWEQAAIANYGLFMSCSGSLYLYNDTARSGYDAHEYIRISFWRPASSYIGTINTTDTSGNTVEGLLGYDGAFTNDEIFTLFGKGSTSDDDLYCPVSVASSSGDTAFEKVTMYDMQSTIQAAVTSANTQAALLQEYSNTGPAGTIISNQQALMAAVYKSATEDKPFTDDNVKANWAWAADPSLLTPTRRPVSICNIKPDFSKGDTCFQYYVAGNFDTWYSANAAKIMNMVSVRTDFASCWRAQLAKDKADGGCKAPDPNASQAKLQSEEALVSCIKGNQSLQIQAATAASNRAIAKINETLGWYKFAAQMASSVVIGGGMLVMMWKQGHGGAPPTTEEPKTSVDDGDTTGTDGDTTGTDGDTTGTDSDGIEVSDTVETPNASEQRMLGDQDLSNGDYIKTSDGKFYQANVAEDGKITLQEVTSGEPVTSTDLSFHGRPISSEFLDRGLTDTPGGDVVSVGKAYPEVEVGADVVSDIKVSGGVEIDSGDYIKFSDGQVKVTKVNSDGSIEVQQVDSLPDAGSYAEGTGLIDVSGSNGDPMSIKSAVPDAVVDIGVNPSVLEDQIAGFKGMSFPDTISPDVMGQITSKIGISESDLTASKGFFTDSEGKVWQAFEDEEGDWKVVESQEEFNEAAKDAMPDAGEGFEGEGVDGEGDLADLTDLVHV